MLCLNYRSLCVQNAAFKFSCVLRIFENKQILQKIVHSNKYVLFMNETEHISCITRPIGLFHNAELLAACSCSHYSYQLLGQKRLLFQ